MRRSTEMSLIVSWNLLILQSGVCCLLAVSSYIPANCLRAYKNEMITAAVRHLSVIYLSSPSTMGAAISSAVFRIWYERLGGWAWWWDGGVVISLNGHVGPSSVTIWWRCPCPPRDLAFFGIAENNVVHVLVSKLWSSNHLPMSLVHWQGHFLLLFCQTLLAI